MRTLARHRRGDGLRARARGRASLARRLRRAALAAALGTALANVALVLPWRWIDPPTTAFMLRERWVHRRAVHQRWVAWDGISRQLPIAVVAAEDQKFPFHHGFDFDSILDAAQESRRRPRGASTISQQVAKNLFLWPGRSLLRKGIEAWITVWIELLWPKRRILDVYLNVAQFGPGVFGVGEASERLLGTSPRRLTPEQAALLAAVLPSPRRMSAAEPSEYVRSRAAEIEESVRDLGGPAYLSGL